VQGTGRLGLDAQAREVTILTTRSSSNVLCRQFLERVAVVVNEFGEVGIDSKLVVQTNEHILEMNNGCICCTVRSYLPCRILWDLMQRQDKFDHLLIEATGLADPGRVIQSFFTNEIVHSQTPVWIQSLLVVDAKTRLGGADRFCGRDLD